MNLPDINEYMQALRASARMGKRVIYHRLLDGQAADYAEPEKPWPARISAILQKFGVTQLYRHQVAAIDHIRAGRHVAAATATASGKTLIYNLPVLENIMNRPEAKALYIFPLKALAQDQLRSFQKLAEGDAGLNAEAKIYDGDTAHSERRKIRENPPQALLTNPEMIHLSLLAYHHLWCDFWRGLEVVVVDEVHTYRGVMGSHMSQVFRRLRRICAHYGSAPTFIFSSATVANPSQLAEQLTGLQPETVTQSTAPKGKQHIALLQADEGVTVTTVLLLKAAIHRKLRTIVYTQSRKMAELIALKCKQSLRNNAERVSAYRAGFLPDERRAIESGLANGDLLAVISTSALELGIDIGDLDLCLLVGYPGSIVATWQRVGRVGRNGQDSAAILIAGEDALDQYFLRHPRALLERLPESAVANPWNPVILKKHLVCAAAEKPLISDDPLLSPPAIAPVLRQLADDGELLRAAEGDAWLTPRQYPHRTVDLRGASSRYRIIDAITKRIIGDIDELRAFEETHPGAIYIHKGDTYLIDTLDVAAKTIMAKPERTDYYTRIRAEEQTDILEALQEQTAYNTRVYFGRLKITRQVVGFEKCGLFGKHNPVFVPLELPPLIYETEGLWWLIPSPIRRQIDAQSLDFSGGIHAMEHAAIGVFPLLVMADRNDLGGLSTPCHHQTGQASIFIYDGVPGGAGLTQAAFQQIEQLFDDTREVMEHCSCNTGCPSCAHSPKCGSGNRPIDKAAAIEILIRLKHSTFNPIPAEKGIAMPATTIDHPKPAPSPAASYGVFDLETQLSAEEVGGWHYADRMRISCAVLYDSTVDDYLVYYENQTSELIARMQSLSLIVGFNTLAFDYLVLKAYSDFSFQKLPNLDILLEVKAALGSRRSLDHIARCTLGTPKSAGGLQAIEWWKQGRIQDIVDYCRKDVEITRNLYLFGKNNGYLLVKNDQGQVLRVPASWAKQTE